MTMLELLLILTIVLTFAGAASKSRPAPGPSWFDIVPHLHQSQKQKTRLQQTRRHGARRY